MGLEKITSAITEAISSARLLTIDGKIVSFELPFNPTSFKLSRNVSWAEQAPAFQPYTNLTFGNGAATAAVPVSFDLSRTVLVTSSQAAGGQSGLETADTGATLGDAQVVIDCNAVAGTCTATRGSTGSSASATVYAVQLDPR